MIQNSEEFVDQEWFCDVCCSYGTVRMSVECDVWTGVQQIQEAHANNDCDAIPKVINDEFMPKDTADLIRSLLSRLLEARTRLGGRMV